MNQHFGYFSRLSPSTLMSCYFFCHVYEDLKLIYEDRRAETQSERKQKIKTGPFLWIPADSDSGSLTGRFDCFHGDRWVPPVRVSGQACPGSEPATHKPFKAKATKPADLRGLTPTPWLPLRREGGGREGEERREDRKETGEREREREREMEREEKNRIQTLFYCVPKLSISASHPLEGARGRI